MEFVILGMSPRDRETIKKAITKLGGKVVTKIQNTVMAIITTPDEVAKTNNRRIQEAKWHNIHAVSEDFVDSAKDYAGRIPELVLEKSIGDWGSDVSKNMYWMMDISDLVPNYIQKDVDEVR